MHELQQLLRFAGNIDASCLVALDENSSTLPQAPGPNAMALSNRLDVCLQARSKGWLCDFSDFDFSLPEFRNIRHAFYRISKEKRVVEHVLDSLWLLLPQGGTLYCAGYKNEGIKTFAKRAQAAWACDMTLERGDQNLHLYRFTKTNMPAAPLNPDDYHALHLIGEWQGMPLWSKPGVFAWDRLDEGSLYLLEQLPSCLETLGLAVRAQAPPLHRNQVAGKRGLDLGCGHGLLALALLQAGCQSVVATDNNAAALKACAHNLSLHAGSAETSVIAADCASGIEERFDLILCNPPFHQGFSVEQDLTDRFLQAARRLMARRGTALFVVNSFIPLERKAEGLFGTVQLLADNRRFKVVRLGIGSHTNGIPV
jgi:16S rRNA (guanine1207-N2)-methyltransferase